MAAFTMLYARPIVALISVMLVIALSGCGGYVLRGKVVRGITTDAYLVSADDSRLNDEGVSDVKIVVWRDPNRLNRQRVADGRSGPDGSFTIPIREFGAGWMEEQWMIEIFRTGYQTGSATMTLPGSPSKTPLIVTIAPGPSSPLQAPDPLMDQYERYR